MKKRIKIKKIILSCFTAICLGLGLIAPFINNNNDIVVNAESTNSVEFTSNGFTYSQTVKELDGSESFLSKSFVAIETSSVIENSNSTLFKVVEDSDFVADLTDNYYLYYSNSGFGDSYGFYVTGIAGFFNGFIVESDGSISLADISFADGRINFTDVFYLADVNYEFYCTYSSNSTIQEMAYYSGSNMSLPTFLNYFYDNILFYHNGNYNMSKWHSGNFLAFSFADYFALADYFNIERDLVSYSGHYIFNLNGDIYMENNYLCYQGLLHQYYYQLTMPSFFRFTDMTLDELSFIYSCCNLNYYPSAINSDVSSFPSYYRLNHLNNLYYGIVGFNITFTNLDGSFISDITSISIGSQYGNEGDVYFLDNNGPIFIYNIFTRTWFSPFSNTNNYIIFLGTFSIFSYQLNQLLYIGTPYDSLPQIVKGWYTFDIAPFDSITESVDIDLDISFTADSNGYNNLRIIGDSIQGTYVATIYYRNLDDEGTVINEYVPYQYQRLPYQSEWTTFNARQLFFDETLIDGDVYNTLNDLGVFTFISNNSNNNQTMVDLFWGIAEVPIVTVRKVFDFEILGTNVTNFIMSMITISIILFLIRRLF